MAWLVFVLLLSLKLLIFWAFVFCVKILRFSGDSHFWNYCNFNAFLVHFYISVWYHFKGLFISFVMLYFVFNGILLILSYLWKTSIKAELGSEAMIDRFTSSQSDFIFASASWPRATESINRPRFCWWAQSIFVVVPESMSVSCKIWNFGLSYFASAFGK